MYSLNYDKVWFFLPQVVKNFDILMKELHDRINSNILKRDSCIKFYLKIFCIEINLFQYNVLSK